MSSNNHVKWQKTIYFDTPKEDPNKTDSFYIIKSINGWSVRFSVDERIKISVIAWKTLGELGSLVPNPGSEAQLELKLETTEHRTPGIKIISGSNPYESKLIEVDDRKDRNTKSFEQESEYYKRVYPASSVLTPEELFNEMIPNYIHLLNDKKFSEYVSNISKETKAVQKPFNKSWKDSK